MTAEERKRMPIATGVLGYFPLAIKEVARVSLIGNEQHHPGEPLHWDKPKSNDHEDAMLRHLMDHQNGIIWDEDTAMHLGKTAWRALAALQTFLEKLQTEEMEEEIIKREREDMLYNSEEDDRMDIIGRNGNEGLHYGPCSAHAFEDDYTVSKMYPGDISITYDIVKP